ncbi:ABC transporter ATP-binding protein [Nesterenkonia ebinurensis]|uniref:ABC transporter ATP-binding protein n=1 Tax=Nesterenkonia ebinurensis TaxID=2608252 RepID=UPI00123C8007|nr:ABC transporter ATP-binding protein [Nesterenkonia ebinurensis]
MRVSLQDLQIHYGKFHAVKDLDLEVPDGTSLVLLGPSGCGKTTTMRSVAGLEAPTGGRITVGERDVFNFAERTNVPPNKRNVSMVFQSYAIWPHKTVYENVAFPLQMKKLSRSDVARKVGEVLELTGMSQYEKRGASELSGGQMQRVALSRSLAMDPAVMLLDEPLSNLDALLRVRLRTELRRIQQEQGLTTIYVTHDQSEALALADNIAMMRAGGVVQYGTPKDLYQNPVDVEAASFMGYQNIFSRDDSSACVISARGLNGRSDSGDHVCFRASHVKLEATNDDSADSGSVTSLSYQGDNFLATVEMANGLIVQCEIPQAALTLQRGDKVRVSVDEGSIRQLPVQKLGSTDA